MKELVKKLVELVDSVSAKDIELNKLIGEAKNLIAENGKEKKEQTAKRSELTNREKAVSAIEDVVAAQIAIKEKTSEANQLMSKAKSEWEEYIKVVERRNAEQNAEDESLKKRAAGLSDKEERLNKKEEELKQLKKDYKKQVVDEFKAGLK